MASVQSSRKRRYESLAFGEEPTPHIESEGDRLIKDLSRKQLDTTLSLEKQMQNEKQFDRGSGFVPLSVYEAGTSSAHEIVSKTVWAQKFEQLLHHGLTADEATAVLNGGTILHPNSKAEGTVRQKRAEEIKSILEKINKKEDTDERELISRHEKELALAVKPASDETKLFAFAMACKSGGESRPKDTRPLQHPINQLNEIHDQLFADHNPKQAAKTVLRKRRQMLESLLPPQQVPFEPVSGNRTKSSNWDKQTVVENKPQLKHTNREYTCKRQTFYTIKDGKIVELKNKKAVEESQQKEEAEKVVEKLVIGGEPFVVPQCEKEREKLDEERKIVQERMSLEDIRSIPRFRDYVRGQPSKVLYLKNLSRGVDEQDLVQLFSKYQSDNEPHIVYRLLTGRMSGQAFVTFSSIEQATLALDDAFGVVVKGKPVVIQFGRIT